MAVQDPPRRHSPIERLLAVAYLLTTIGFLFTTSLQPHRHWAILAIAAYAVALVAAMLPLTRNWAPYLAAGGAVAVPLMILALSGLAQPEVDALVGGARAILEHGTPYVDHPANLGDVRPYLPLLFAFGIPSALGWPNIPADPRILIDVTYVVALVTTIAQRGGPLNAATSRWIAYFLAMPLMALTLSVSSIDLPLAAAVLLAALLMASNRPVWAGAVTGAALALKPTAAILLLLGIITTWRLTGAKEAAKYLGAAALVVAAIVGPVALSDPGGILFNVLQFPAGQTDLASPAQTPFPGVLLAQTTGPLVPLGLLAVGLIVNLVHALRRPSLDFRILSNRLALAFTTVYLLAPNSRAGYLVLPATLWFTTWLLGHSREVPVGPEAMR